MINNILEIAQSSGIKTSSSTILRMSNYKLEIVPFLIYLIQIWYIIIF